MLRALSSGVRVLRCELTSFNRPPGTSILRKPKFVSSFSSHQGRATRFLHASSVRKTQRTIDYKLSDIGEGISEVVLKEWFVSVGCQVSQFDPVCEVQSDKASVTITSRYDGTIRKLNHEIGQTCKVGDSLMEIEIAGDLHDRRCPSSSNGIITETVQGEFDAKGSVQDAACDSTTIIDKIIATPAVRRFATDMNIPLNVVTASGRNGRVLKDDIVAYLQRHTRKTNRTSSETSTDAVELEPKIVKHNNFTQAMFKTMTKSLEIPRFGYQDEINMDALVAIRSDLNEEAKKVNLKLSYMPFFIKAVSVALHEFPILNASLSECQGKMILKNDHNIGLAMDTPHGLVVPNIKNCQAKSIFEIGAELNRLVGSSTSGKLNPADLVGGTFSLSNIGSIGGTYAFPVVVPPEVCIGAVGKIRKLPRFSQGGEIIACNVLNVSWSADHRVIDGATVSKFSNAWKNYLEKPHLLLMNLR